MERRCSNQSPRAMTAVKERLAFVASPNWSGRLTASGPIFERMKDGTNGRCSNWWR